MLLRLGRWENGFEVGEIAVGKVLAFQAWGLEFDLQNPNLKKIKEEEAGCGGAHMQSWQGRDRRCHGAPWPASLAPGLNERPCFKSR